MRIALLTLLSLALCTSVFPQENAEARRCRRGQAAGYASRDATVLSMMGWGLGLAVGMAALCALIENVPASTASTGGDSDGNTTH